MCGSNRTRLNCIAGCFLLSLDKIGFTSELKIKNRFTSFYFVFLSACTIFK